jgi:hypothetical protein
MLEIQRNIKHHQGAFLAIQNLDPQILNARPTGQGRLRQLFIARRKSTCFSEDVLVMRKAHDLPF